MKNLYIEKKNEDKINDLIAEVEGQAVVRTLEYSDLEEVVRRAENRLDAYGVPKAKRAGAACSTGYYDQPAKCYKYRFLGTVADLARNTHGWYIVSVVRTDCNGITKNRLYLTDEQNELVKSHAVKSVAQM